MSGCVHQVAVHEHRSKTAWDRFVLAYTPGVLRVFCSDGFQYVIARAFSTSAFSTPAIYSCISHSCIFSAPVADRNNYTAKCLRAYAFGRRGQVGGQQPIPKLGC